jgi:hypothetical protein
MKFAPYELGTQWLYAVNSKSTNIGGMCLLILNGTVIGKVEDKKKQSSIVMVSLVFP